MYDRIDMYTIHYYDHRYPPTTPTPYTPLPRGEGPVGIGRMLYVTNDKERLIEKTINVFEDNKLEFIRITSYTM